MGLPFFVAAKLAACESPGHRPHRVPCRHPGPALVRQGRPGPRVQLRAELREQDEANEKARARNTQLQAELLDLREGLEMVEEKARMELGMVKPDEVFVPLRR
ncbi:septum formation initiator family protein [Roseateles sp. UC29_93]|uniref:septum formation initiator family protein n=1 Tax=Roseateles sp. UC29_93 TaxID=3350177 RepID=UPI00366E5CF3